MNDDEYRALVEQAHQVHELTQHPGWDILLDYLRFSEGALARRQILVLEGHPASYHDYREKVGWIEGVQYAIDAPDRLAKVIENERARRADRERETDAE